jgi:hypothetical protein
VPIAVTENCGGTTITCGADIATPKIKLFELFPPVGRTAAGAVVTVPGIAGAIVTAIGVLPVFKKPQKFTWSLPAGVIVTAVELLVVTVIAVVGPTKRKAEVFAMIKLR